MSSFSDQVNFWAHMLDEALRVDEYDGNDLWVNVNNTPGKLRLGNCGVRAMSFCSGLDHKDIMLLMKKVYPNKVRMDKDGNPTPSGDYGMFAFAMLGLPEIQEMIDDVYDFTGQKDNDMIDVFNFTQMMSSKAPFRGKKLMLIVDMSHAEHRKDRKLGKKNQENLDRLERRAMKRFNLNSLIQRVKDDGEDAVYNDHALAAKDGRYYDMFDSGEATVKFVIVFKQDSNKKTRRIAKDKLGSIGSDNDAVKVLDKAKVQLNYPDMADDSYSKMTDKQKASYRKNKEARTRHNHSMDVYYTGQGLKELLKMLRIPRDRKHLKDVIIVDPYDNVIPFLESRGFGSGRDFPGVDLGDIETPSIDEIGEQHLKKNNVVFNLLHSSEPMLIDTEFYLPYLDEWTYVLEMDNKLTYKMSKKLMHQVYVLKFKPIQ